MLSVLIFEGTLASVYFKLSQDKSKIIYNFLNNSQFLVGSSALCLSKEETIFCALVTELCFCDSNISINKHIT